ncbi:MAG: hypothetical protein KAT34_20575 [Candidatus Aminicenantes bacterium]|nr:hypothetical protein [Candidatus Aminicenantes bacterium]
METLSGSDLINLIRSVFPAFPGDKQLGILVDVPVDIDKDNGAWKLRRKMAEDWYNAVKYNASAAGLDQIKLLAYTDVGSNNADLPEEAYIIREKLPISAELLSEEGDKISFDRIFKEFQLFLAPTEYSTTAPLKMAAKKFGFRAATMPGFSSEMIPALRIDYNEVFRRVEILKQKLDPAEWAEVIFVIDSHREFKMFFDLRFRTAHLSPGRFPDAGVAGNLPSGETYIVPYEGEKGEKTGTAGTLPVQVGDGILLFTVKENRAVEVASCDPGQESTALEEERDHLKREPAYGNMAELGFGVLGDFGLRPIDEILLDEKLGFHIAFGRSDHFNGIVGPKDFSSPKEVIHLDRIYIPATQPLVHVKSVVLGYENNRTEEILRDGEYLIF